MGFAWHEMRKLRDGERGHQVRLEPCIEDKLHRGDNSEDHYKKGDDCVNLGEVERLRELAIEQQEIIEFLRQALKERERKLEQLSNKKRKEEFYKQWLELEPVAEVDDEEEHEEGDSALSSAPSSLSPQPGGIQWHGNSVTREAYETLLVEFEELQTKYLEEQQELYHAKSQVRDLEKALLQETRGSQNSRRALSDKLKEAEERESGLLAELSELREQNELLEFRVLELEETGGPREISDTADSGIVSPEPSHHLLQMNQNNKQQRAIATVIPYNSYNNQTTNLSSMTLQKNFSLLQESGIFEEEEDDRQIEFTSCSTQTETPSGELLQEVQRLQQLRERIQERAVKVPVQVQDNVEIIEDNRLTFCKERIKELEERLEIHEIAEVKRSRDQTVAKQREEDLLDENYRLSERVYWLENEIHNYQGETKVDKETCTDDLGLLRDFGTCTDDGITGFDSISKLSKCQTYFLGTFEISHNHETCLESKMDTQISQIEENNLENLKNCADCQNLRKEYNEKVQQLSETECSLRRQIMDLKEKEVAFETTLEQVNTSWSQVEFNYSHELEKMQVEISKKNIENQEMTQMIFELKNISQPMDIDENSKKFEFSRSTQTDLTFSTEGEIGDDFNKLTREEGSREGCEDDVDGPKSLENESDTTLEKVRKRWNCRNEQEGWAMKVSKTSQNSLSVENIRSIIDHHRLILYPEICV